MSGASYSIAFEMTNGGNGTTNMSGSFQQPLFAAIIFIIIGVVGTIGNALVCIVIASTLSWSKSGSTSLLIVNQALVDASTSFILILEYTLPNPFISASGGWSEFLCRMWVAHSLLWMLFVVSTFNLCMMSLERYFAVAYPMIYSTRFKKRTSFIMILFCWIVAPLLHYYYPIAVDHNDGGRCSRQDNPNVSATIGILVFVWEFFIPFIIMAIVYARIVFLLRRQQRRIRAADLTVPAPSTCNGQPTIRFQGDSSVQRDLSVSARTEATSGAHRQADTNQPQRRRAPSETVRRNVTVTLLAVFVMYVVCWMPNHLTFLQFGLGGPLDLSGGWYYTTLILAYLNMSINPFIYALKYKLFREGFKRLFLKRCYGQHERRNFTEHSSMPPPRQIATVSGSDRS